MTSTKEKREVTLHAERPVVGTETEAVERVRLGKETVTATETVASGPTWRRAERGVQGDGRTEPDE